MGYITKVKSKSSNETFDIYDLKAVKSISLNGEPQGMDGNGHVNLKFSGAAAASDNMMGLVLVKSLLTEGDIQYPNDLKLTPQVGALVVDIPIHKITVDGREQKPKSKMDKTVDIKKSTDTPKAVTTLTDTPFGVVATKNEGAYAVKCENGYLYVQFSEGYTDIIKEVEDIDFDDLINNKYLVLPEEDN